MTADLTTDQIREIVREELAAPFDAEIPAGSPLLGLAERLVLLLGGLEVVDTRVQRDHLSGQQNQQLQCAERIQVARRYAQLLLDALAGDQVVGDVHVREIEQDVSQGAAFIGP
jgi:hypothetical protein